MTDQTPVNDSDADPTSISMQAARDIIFSRLPTLSQTERIPVASALGRVLSDEVASPINVPPFRASAMDGYAFRFNEASTALNISAHSLAGHPSDNDAGKNECHRITTGARVPDFADTVVQQENIEVRNGKVHIVKKPVKGFHVRPPGSDSVKGSSLMSAGQRLAAAQIACLYSHGITHVDVLKPLRVCVFSTGDELAETGETLPEGHIYDANRALLAALLNNPAVQVTDLGIVKDSIEAMQDAFERCKAFDLVISSGGVSVGDADFVRPVLEKAGELHMWKIAMKPGRPLTFGLLDKHKPYFGLPGNPVSAAVTCMMFVIPTIQKLLNQPATELPRISATLNTDLKKLPGRVEYQRGMLIRTSDDTWEVSTTGLQDSHVITSLHRANCFVELGFDNAGVKKGTTVSVIPFEHFSESIL